MLLVDKVRIDPVKNNNIGLGKSIYTKELDSPFKGTVQRKLIGVESDINRKVFLSH